MPPITLTSRGRVRTHRSRFQRWGAACTICGTHTHASHLISKGIDVLTSSRRLGHNGPIVTLTFYGHLFASTGPAARGMETTFAMDATFATSAPDG